MQNPLPPLQVPRGVRGTLFAAASVTAALSWILMNATPATIHPMALLRPEVPLWLRMLGQHGPSVALVLAAAATVAATVALVTPRR